MNTRLRAAVATLAAAALFGCGGGSSGLDSGGTGGTGIVSSGVMTKGSVVLNGIRFEDTTANIRIDDTPKTALNLQSGMVVKVRGTIDAGGNATAQRVEAQSEVRGIVTSVNLAASPQSFTVLGQTVIVDDLTLYSNLAGIGALVAGTTVVEVHGLRDANGTIRATRVEGSLTAQPDGTGMADPSVDEIRGVVSNRDDPSDFVFDVGTLTVNAAGAVVSPAGADFGNGSVLEVHCSARPSCVNGLGQFVASRVDVEDAEDAAFQPGQGERYEAEGLVSGFTAHPGNFFVAGVAVTTSSATEFEGGVATDLGNSIKVEAEGTWNGSALVARKIEFKRSVVRVQGVVTVSSAPTFTLDVAGRSVTIETNGFTDGTFPPVGPACVQVRGERKAVSGAVIVAGEIDDCSSSDRPLIQAPVEAESPETTITLLGFAIDVSNPTDTPDQWIDLDEQPLTRTAFFSAVTPATAGPPAVAGTLVKVTFESGTNLVRQVELED